MKNKKLNCIRNAIAAAVAVLATAAVSAAPRLAFQVYVVRELCEKDFVGTLKAAKAMGYEGVETGRFFGRDAPSRGRRQSFAEVVSP